MSTAQEEEEMIPTRKEFEKLLGDFDTNVSGDTVVRVWGGPDPNTAHQSHTALLAVYDAMFARIAELEEESATWEKSSVAVPVARRAEQDRRISMLETELGRARDIIDRAASRCQHFQKRATELEAVLDCRAGRLLLKGATFVVVRDDEPYYCQAYRLIRDHERAIGRWTDCDEVYFVRQCGGDTDTPCRAGTQGGGEMTQDEFIEQLYDYRNACIGIYDENPILAAACRKEALEREEILHTAFGTQSARIAELEAALHALVNNLPDLVLDLAGPEIGWSNVSAIRSARDAARAALEHKEA
jgi:hypothetical protein